MSDSERTPPEHRQTWREALYHELRQAPQTIRELSILIGAQQKELLDHLSHLERSLVHSGEKLVIDPAYCLVCKFEFSERTRLAKPGRCPQCKSTRIALPKFSISESSR